jgi:hypothetical protein
MKLSNCMSVMVLVSLLLAASSRAQDPSPSDQPGRGPGRIVERDRNQRMFEYLQATDEEVTVLDSGHEPDVVEAPQGFAIQVSTELAAFVAVIKVNRRCARISDDERWIVTSVEATVEDILKDTTRPRLTVGSAIEFHEDGGEIQTPDGRRVSAQHDWAAPFRVDGRYLVFGSVNPEAGEISIGPATSYEFVGSKLRDMYRTRRPNEFSYLPQSLVLEMIRKSR